MGTVLSVIGYVLPGIVVIALLLPLLPISVRLTYHDELTVRISVLGIVLFRYPSLQSTDDKQQRDKLSEEAKQPTLLMDLSRSLKEDGVGTVLTHLQGLARIAVGAVRRVLAAVTVDRLTLRLYIASEDASATAQNVGRVCGVVYPALTTIQAFVRVRRRDVTVTPDYLAEQGRVRGDIRLHAIPYCVLLAMLIALPAYLKWKKTLQQPKEEEQQYG